MLEADIHFTRPGGFTLDLSLQVSSGVTALYGPSGSGKSTILKLLAGLQKTGAGDQVRVVNDGVTWQDRQTTRPTHERNLGYVLQQPWLLSHTDVAGNLDYALKRRRIDTGITKAQVVEWLELDALLKKRPGTLSGGEAQRVAIGRALLGNARCLMMDEPLASVDRGARQRILAILEGLRRELDIPMLYISHSLEEVHYLADQVIVLANGRIVASGSVFETSTSPELNRDAGDAVASVIECSYHDYDPDHGLATLGFGEHQLFVQSTPMVSGDMVRVRVPARDVSIAVDHPGRTSVLNIVPATVAGIVSDSAGDLVQLKIQEQSLLARITRKSTRQLGLRPGDDVFAQIKGIALMTHVH